MNEDETVIVFKLTARDAAYLMEFLDDFVDLPHEEQSEKERIILVLRKQLEG